MWRARTRVMVPALSLILGLVVSAAAAAGATPSAAEVKAAYAQLEQQQGGPLVASMAKAVQEVVLDGVISPAEAPFAEALTAAAADGAVDIMEFAGLSQAMAPLLMAAAQQPPPVEVPAAPPVPDQLQIALSLDGGSFDARALLPILPDAAVQNALMLEWRTPDGARQGRSLGAPKGSDLVDMGSIESNLGVPPYDIRLVLAPSNDPEGPGTLPLTDWQPVQPQTGGVENIVLPLVAPLARLDLTLAARNGRALAGGQVTLGLQNPRFESGDYGDVTVPVDAKGGATVWVTPGRYRVSAVTWHDPANPGETHDTDDSSFGDDNWLDLQGGGRYAIRRTFADIGGAAVRFTVARDGRAVSPIPEVHVFSPKTNPDGSEPEVAAAKNGEPVTLDAGDYDVWTSWRAADGALYLGRRSVRVDAGSAPSFAVSLQKAATLVWHGLKIGEDPPVDLPLSMDRDIGADVSGYQTIIDASGKPIPPLHAGGAQPLLPGRYLLSMPYPPSLHPASGSGAGAFYQKEVQVAPGERLDWTAEPWPAVGSLDVRFTLNGRPLDPGITPRVQVTVPAQPETPGAALTYDPDRVAAGVAHYGVLPAGAVAIDADAGKAPDEIPYGATQATAQVVAGQTTAVTLELSHLGAVATTLKVNGRPISPGKQAEIEFETAANNLFALYNHGPYPPGQSVINLDIQPGTYNEIITYHTGELELTRTVKNLVVKAGETVPASADFALGTLRAEVYAGGKNVTGAAKADLTVLDASGEIVNDARVDPAADGVELQLEPGVYDVQLVFITDQGLDGQEWGTVRIEAGATNTLRVDR